MPNNYGQALGNLNSLERRFEKDPIYEKDYKEFMSKFIAKGYLERIPENEPRPAPGKCWYLVHHGVYHRTKNKIRVVFDCSRKSAGISLNDMLLTGPDLLNNLVGVLVRFREQPVAVAGDLEAMFMQIKVPPKHADFMRVLWWPEGNSDLSPKQYRLKSHTFSAVSSPSVANYAVQRAAKDCINCNDIEAVNRWHCKLPKIFSV